MQICDLQSSTGRLKRSAKTLREKWKQTQEHWNDKTSREFEEKYLQAIFPEITLAVAAIQRLNEMLEQADHDCRDRDGG